jgi:hypothetical protein
VVSLLSMCSLVVARFRSYYAVFYYKRRRATTREDGLLQEKTY